MKMTPSPSRNVTREGGEYMTEAEIQQTIERELEKRHVAVLNRNAYKALFAALSNPIAALGKIFLGRKEAVESERSRIIQEVILNMLVGIDKAISAANREAAQNRLSWKVISGLIEVNAEDVEEVTGVDIPQESGPVELKPGTHIRTSATRARRVTGLKIGGSAPPDKDE